MHYILFVKTAEWYLQNAAAAQAGEKSEYNKASIRRCRCIGSLRGPRFTVRLVR
jgi:hypothetical protein